MFELFRRARWDQAYDYLQSGDPPVVWRLLGINLLFLGFYVIRRAKVMHRMRESTAMQAQAFLIIANVLVLFQSDIQHQIARIIARI